MPERSYDVTYYDLDVIVTKEHALGELKKFKDR